MLISATYSSSGYRQEAVPDFSRFQDRERLSQSAMDGFFAIAERWELSAEQQCELLGGISKSNLYKLKTGAGLRTQDELTRISYVVGISKALYVLLPEEPAEAWMTMPNDHPLFGGHTPMEYVRRNGIPGLQEVRRLLDSYQGGQ